MKAGLKPNSWEEEDIKIFKFTGQIFYEIKPRGDVKEKKINGSNS
jgi:AMMECR1 domain-containing protein